VFDKAHLTHANYCRIVDENISTALILEDDVDWDLNIREMMGDFSDAMHVLSHPTPYGSMLDPTYPKPDDDDDSVPVNLTLHETVTRSRISPYGDHWDLLWIGHCAAALTHEKTRNFNKGKVVWNDQSVPEKRYIMYQDDWRLKETYPDHTRVVHRSSSMVCLFGYAITQKMAQRMLYHIGIKKINTALDFEYAQFCEGWWTEEMPKCYAIEPPYFGLFRPAGSKAGHSDQSEMAGYQEDDWSPNVRYSAMQNIENWVEGRELVDIAPNTESED
jgi:hypothetical protein